MLNLEQGLLEKIEADAALGGIGGVYLDQFPGTVDAEFVTVGILDFEGAIGEQRERVV